MLDKLPMEQIYDGSIREAIGTLFLTAAVAENALTLSLLRLLGHLHSQNPLTALPLQGQEGSHNQRFLLRHRFLNTHARFTTKQLVLTIT